MRRSIAMIRTTLLLAAGFFAFDTLLPQLSAAEEKPLAALKWDNRPLLIFAPDDESAEEQWQVLKKDEAGLKDRDMVVLVITDRVETRMGTGPHGITASALRSYYGVPAQRYESILVGKDGTRKALWRDPVEAEAIFRIIDAMPMRQREMSNG